MLSGGTSNRSVAGGTAPPPPSTRGPIAGRRQPSARHSSSLFGEAKRPSGAGAPPAVPFSESWREQVTPDLTGPSGGGSSAPTGGGSVGRATIEPSGPTVASRRPSGSRGSGQTRPGGRNAGSGWRAEARQFAGRARALSRQVGQMAQDGTGTETASSKKAPSKGETAVRSAAGTGASASGPGSPGDPSRRGDPGDPQSVPIGDHLHWLAVLGVLWGAWRIWLGG